MKMKHVCRICLKEINDLNFVARAMAEAWQIKMQLSICVPEMVVDLVKDPIFCKFCVSVLHSAYNFKNLCLSTEKHIQNYSRKVLHSKSFDIEDMLYDLKQCTTRSSGSENNGEGKNTKNKNLTITSNINLLLSDKYLADGQNLNTERNVCQHSVTLPIDASNKINNLNNVTANDFSKPAIQVTADQINTLLDDPLLNAPIQLRVLKQENEDITIKEEDIALPKVEWSLSFEGFEDNLFEHAESEDHTAQVKSIDNDSAILQTNLVTQNCFVKLTTLPNSIVYKHNSFYRCTQHGNLQALPRIHTSEKTFACKARSIRSSQNSSLPRRHTGEKPFACNVCTYRTVRKSNLERHLQIHTGEKPFACNVCTYRSAHKFHLQNHLRVHTGEKPFACNVCNVCFAQKSDMQRHLRIHTGEKPFACSVCNFRFAHKSVLQKHLLIHTGEKPFPCNVCAFRFARKSSLQEHLRIHTGEKPYACNVCNFRSSQKSGLRRHLQKHS